MNCASRVCQVVGFNINSAETLGSITSWFVIRVVSLINPPQHSTLVTKFLRTNLFYINKTRQFSPYSV